jgi:hypothetical protein
VTQSPIEEALLAEMVKTLHAEPTSVIVEAHGIEEGPWPALAGDLFGTPWVIVPQLEMRITPFQLRGGAPVYVANLNVRVDFAVFVRALGGGWFPIIVECDGHDFHERTKEQAANDRLRDRTLMGDGWMVVRVTGAEIMADPERAAVGVTHLCRDLATLWIRSHVSPSMMPFVREAP